jgi:Protein of unknown function (DUF2442)
VPLSVAAAAAAAARASEGHIRMNKRTARITACKPEKDYTLWLCFDDGRQGRVYLGNLLEIGSFKLWRDPREFEKVMIDPDAATIVWEVGIRLDPSILYADIVAQTTL